MLLLFLRGNINITLKNKHTFSEVSFINQLWQNTGVKSRGFINSTDEIMSLICDTS